MLDDEVTVEHHGFHLGQHRIVAVEVLPANLDHPDVLVGEEVHRALEDVGRRDEVGVEHEDELPLARPQTIRERAGLEARAVRAVQVLDVEPERAQLFDLCLAHGLCLVRRIVENLDLEAILRIADLRDRLEQPRRDVHLVEERQLDRDERHRVVGELGLLDWLVAPVLVVHEEEKRAVKAVHREREQRR